MALIEELNDLKVQTIEKFVNTFSRLLPVLVNTNHRLRGAFSDPVLGIEFIEFQFVTRKILLRYSLNLKKDITVYAYYFEFEADKFPERKLLLSKDLTFTISKDSNNNGFKNYLFNGKSFCMGNSAEGFFWEYFETFEKVFY